MASVPTAPSLTANTWTCPTCRHGSPDRRDEAAHLDAHRQLGQFLREWDEAVVADRRKERRRRPLIAVLAGATVLAGLAVVMVLVAGSLFRSFERSGGSDRPRSAAGAAPAALAPAPAPRVAPEPGVAPALGAGQTPAPAPSRPIAAAPAPAAPAAPAPVTGSFPVASPAAAPGPESTTAPVAVAPPPAPAPVAPAPTLQAVLGADAGQPPAHLLELCLGGPCLTVL